MTTSACEETYGVFPCSTTLPGSIVLILAYGYLLLQGAKLLSDGSELLLEVLNPGIIGGLLLPVLGALPDALIIIVSGLGGSREEAAEQVSVGVGTLAGSTIMLLTIAWAGSLLYGRCDLSDRGTAVNKRLTQPWRLWQTGVTTDAFTPKGAAIMVASVFLYGIVQVPSFLGSKEGPASLAGAIVCLIMLAVYCIFQVVYPELQRRRMQCARQRQWKYAAVRALQRRLQPVGSMLNRDGEIDEGILRNLFASFDSNGDGAIDEGELKGLLVGLSLAIDGSGSLQKELEFWMHEMDVNRNGAIEYREFSSMLRRWIKEKMAQQSAHRKGRNASPGQANTSPGDATIDVSPLLQDTDDEEDERAMAEAGEQDEDEEAPDDENGEGGGIAQQEQVAGKGKNIIRRAAALLLAGTAICALISDPMVEAVSAFSKASGIPPFYVAFCVTPYASNASELVSSFMFASRKQRKNISLTFSQVYGAVTMNNTMCLGLFLLVIYLKGLPWEYSSEVLVTVGVTCLVGLLGFSKTTFRAFWAIPVLLLYPLSILAVWGLDRLGFK